MDTQVQDIKDRVHIADVVGQYVKLERAGRNMRARCPFHKEKTPSFFVSPERGTYICFGCGEKGDIFSFVQKIENISFQEALQQMAERAGITLKQAHSNAEQYEHKRLFEVCEAATLYFASVLTSEKKVQAYLKERGVEEETTEVWRLGYAPAAWEELCKHLEKQGFSKDEIVGAGLAIRSEKRAGNIYDRFRGRIMFPIANPAGQIIAFSGRFFQQTSGSHDESEPAKYVNSPETPLFKKSRTLYGLNRAKSAIRKADCSLLVEGQFDLVLCHQAGFPFTIALSGTALTEEHLSILSHISKRLILALDADAAGLRSGLKSTHMALSQGFDVKIPRLPEGADPADIVKKNPEDLRAAIRQSQTAIEFFLVALHHTARDERTYKKAVETQILPLVDAIPSKIDQSHFVSLIAHSLGVPQTAVAEELRKIAVTNASFDANRTEEQEAVPLETPGSIERSAAMVLFSFPPESPEVQRVQELLGKERTDAIALALEDQAEEIRFVFERFAEGDDVSVVQKILQSIEWGKLNEEMHQLQQQLHAPGGECSESAILQKISTLKRQQEELRK